ncbi:MAG: hypothetical protein K6F78_03550 [Bacteroidaceae bacterium]|nr:hypothetical protein [Bacteroidaceae bacterium]
MKKLIILVATLLSSLMLNAQNVYVDFWSRHKYDKIKVSSDSLLILKKGAEEKTYKVYKKGRRVDKLIGVLYHRHVKRQHEYFKVRLEEREGKFYINNYEIIMDDSTLIKEIRSYYGSQLNHGSHFSHGSHASHYSSSL